MSFVPENGAGERSRAVVSALAPPHSAVEPLAFQKWSTWGDLHSQGCSGLSRTGLLFPVNHTPVGAPGLAPPKAARF